MSRPSTNVMEHVLRPRNVGRLDIADAVGQSSLGGQAPYTHLYLTISDNRILDARFQTFGCGFSIAACSMMTELVKGRSIDERLPVSAQEVIDNLGGMPDEKRFCAQLAIDALQDAISQWRQKQVASRDRTTDRLTP